MSFGSKYRETWPVIYEEEDHLSPNDEWDHDDWGLGHDKEEHDPVHDLWPGTALYERLQPLEFTKIALAAEKARPLCEAREPELNAGAETSAGEEDQYTWLQRWSAHTMSD
jgi:hypothetical protein